MNEAMFTSESAQAVSAIKTRIAPLLPYGSPALRIVILTKILADECQTKEVVDEITVLLRAFIEP